MAPTTRTYKSAPKRRTEILDAAQKLFTAKGFQATSMEDILNEVGIAKGTLYYHFASKEEILRGLISRTTAQIAEKARAIADTDAPVADKFLAVAATARVEEPERGLAEEFHAAGNAEFHVLSLVEGVRVLAPILTEIVEQGIAEGVFSTEHPREVVEILLTSASVLLDEGFFVGEKDQAERRATGIIYATETLLGCEPGTLSSVLGNAR
jgi:transcriptional regulator, tetR family